MKLFFFPRFEWKYLLFILFFIFSFLQNAIIRWISMNTKDVAQPFLNTYLFNISDYLFIIPFVIIKIRTNRQRRLSDGHFKYLNALKSFSYHIKKKSNKTFYVYLFLVALLDFLEHVSSLIFYLVYGKNDRPVSENNLSFLLIFNTITIYIFSRIILKTYFYKHHYFSFLINIICILIIGAIDIVNINNHEKKEELGMIIFYIIKKLLSIIFYSIEDVLGKKILMEFFFNIYSLLFHRAIFETVLLIIFSFPFAFIEITDVSDPERGPETGIIFERISNLLNHFSFKIIFFIITNFFYNIFIWLIIDKFSPSHYAISNVLESLGTLIRLWITEPNTVDLPVLRMFIYIILVLGGVIHTEMMVINYCGLQENTKLFLETIEFEDMLSIKEKDENEICLDEYIIKISDENDDSNEKNTNTNNNH